jgi:hypothetical protein
VNLEPLVGAAVGAVVFGDPVGAAQAVGTAAILAGIALGTLPLLTPTSSQRAARAACVQAVGVVEGVADEGVEAVRLLEQPRRQRRSPAAAADGQTGMMAGADRVPGRR